MMTWKGPWNSTAQYTQDDVVAYNGSSYIAVVPNPLKGQPPSPAQGWNLVAQAGSPGIVWRGAWQDGSYQINDAVSFEGSSYIAISRVEKGDPPPVENDQITNKWQLLAARGLLGITWRGDWDSQTIYQRNDAVRYESDEVKGTFASLQDNNQNHQPTDEAWWQDVTKDLEAQANNWVDILSVSATAIGTLGLVLVGAISAYIMQKGNVVGNAITAASNLATAANNLATTANNLATTANNAATTAQNTANQAITNTQRLASDATGRIEVLAENSNNLADVVTWLFEHR